MSPASRTSGRWRWSTLLAQRPGAQQRHLRHRHGAVGHQGQAGQHAGLRAAGRQVPRGRRRLRPRRRARSAGSRWKTCANFRSRAIATSASRWAATAARARLPQAGRRAGRRLLRPARLHAQYAQDDRIRAQPGRRRGRAAARHPRAAVARSTRCSSPKTSSRSSCSSWKTRSRRRISSGSAASASSAPRRWRWASCSTTRTSGAC